MSDEREERVHAIVSVMLRRESVWVWSKLGYWVETKVLEVRSSGTVAVVGGVGAVWSYEPGEVHLVRPVTGTRQG